ncbi:pirin family protein [Tepidimonas sp.]|uniref:pirin family protein n=1 Tax=Tepidimonas sp. TaxID=2002775 RepID=UPI00345B6366
MRTHHSFSFAGDFDPRYTGWGPLHVINKHVIMPGSGCAMHGHRDMEILTYVSGGELAHRDSMGHVETIRAGEVQRMGAGRGDAAMVADEAVVTLTEGEDAEVLLFDLARRRLRAGTT